MGEMGEMEGNGGKLGGNGENWREMGGKLREIGELSGIPHGMWVVEGCGMMWLRKMGQNERKMGQNTHFSQSA